jgi:hypothetical protein
MVEPKHRPEVLSGAAGRRSWSAEQKAPIVAESIAGGEPAERGGAPAWRGSIAGDDHGDTALIAASTVRSVASSPPGGTRIVAPSSTISIDPGATTTDAKLSGRAAAESAHARRHA